MDWDHRRDSVRQELILAAYGILKSSILKLRSVARCVANAACSQGDKGPRRTECRQGASLLELTIVLVILAALAGFLLSRFEGVITSAEPVTTRQSLVEIREALLRYWQDIKFTSEVQMAIRSALDSPDSLLPWVQPQRLLAGDTLPAFNPASQIGWRGPYLLTDGSLYRYTELNNSATSVIDDPSFLPNYAADSDPYGRPDSLSVRDGFRSQLPVPLGRPIVVQAIPVSDFNGRLMRIDLRVVSAGENGILEIPLRNAGGDPLTNQELAETHSLQGDDVYVAFAVHP